MAEQQDQNIKSVSQIQTDISQQPPVYPGKPLSISRGPDQRTSVVEEPNLGVEGKLASERNFRPVASVKYPDKNIHLVPFKNTSSRGVSPVGLSGSVTLPIRGENVFDLGDGIRGPMENRLSRLINSRQKPPAGVSQSQSREAGQPSQNSEYVKTELDKLRELARLELSKRQASAKFPIQTAASDLAPAPAQKQPSARPQDQTPAPKQEPSVSIPAQREGGSEPTSNLLSQAQRLEEELRTLQQSLSAGPTQPQTQTQPTPQQAQTSPQDYYAAQVNQLLKEKTELLSKINELAAAYQEAETNREKTQQKIYAITNDFNVRFTNLQNERDRLKNQVEEIEKTPGPQPQSQTQQSAPQSPGEFAGLRNQISALSNEKQSMQNQIQKLEALVKKLSGSRNQSQAAGEAIRPAQTANQEQSEPTAKIVRPQVAIGKMAPSLTTAPNVINGIVKDSKGMLLSNVILVVKGENNEPVRALKSNKIGQFAISTPLPNGTYVIELETAGHSFDLVQVEVKGDVMPPIEIRSHN